MVVSWDGRMMRSRQVSPQTVARPIDLMICMHVVVVTYSSRVKPDLFSYQSITSSPSSTGMRLYSSWEALPEIRAHRLASYLNWKVFAPKKKVSSSCCE